MTSASPELLLDVLPDAELVACAKAGNPNCFGSLYKRHKDIVRRFLNRMVDHSYRVDLEDVEQETFLKAWQHLEQFQERSSIRTWLISIATNEARMQHRRIGYSKKFMALDEPFAAEDEVDQRGRQVAAPGPDPETFAMLKELQEATMKSVDKLPENFREAVRLRLKGLDAREIAARLGISTAATKSRLHRARRVIEANLQQREDPREFRHDRNTGQEGGGRLRGAGERGPRGLTELAVT